MTLRNMVFMINHAKSASFRVYTMFTIFHRFGHAAEPTTIHSRVDTDRRHRTNRPSAASITDTQFGPPDGGPSAAG